MGDVIQQARDALAGDQQADQDAWDALGPMGVIEAQRDRLTRALRAVVDAADNGHLIDTRRIEALSAGERVVCLSYEPGEPWPWEADGENAVRRGRTAADALDAAEREANQRGEPRDLMAALKKSLGIPDDAEREAK